MSGRLLALRSPPSLRVALGAALAAAAWTAVAVAASALLRDADRGIDLTDESHYVLAARPWASTSAFNGVFGWYLGPWSRLLGDDLARLRVSSVVLLLVAALWCARCARVGAERLRGQPWPRWLRWVVPPGVCGAALTWQALFLRVPGYGWFAVTGLLLVAGGLALLVAGGPWRGVRELDVVLSLGVGLGVASVGKLTTGAGATAVVLAGAAVAAAPGRGGPAWAAVARAGGALGVLALLVLGHLVLVADLATTREALARASSVAAAVDPGHYTPSEVPRVAWEGTTRVVTLGGSPWWVLALLPLAGALVVLLPGVRRLRPAVRRAVPTVLCLPGLVVPVVLLVLRYRDPVPALEAAALPGVLAVQTGLAHALSQGVAGRRWRVPVAVLLLAGLALTYPLGTNNDYLDLMTGVVAVLAAGVLLSLWSGTGRGRAAVAAVLAASCAVTAVVTVPAARERKPYRTLPLAQQTVPLDVVPGAPPLLVDPVTAAWGSDLRRGAAAAGWSAGTPLVDLTWHPAAVVLLDARAPSTLLPSFPRLYSRVTSARVALSFEDPSFLRRAWLLVPDPRPTDAAAASARLAGRRFPLDYEAVVTVTTASDGVTMTLWKPRDPGAAP